MIWDPCCEMCGKTMYDRVKNMEIRKKIRADVLYYDDL